MDSFVIKTSVIAVLLTCHNRKDKTIDCLKALFESKQACPICFEMDIFLTDDGSTDGTSFEIKKQFPVVNIFYGSGSLFWTGGMRNSWKEALRNKNYDGFLLLNDDVFMNKSCFDELFKTHEFSISKYGIGGIYIGSVRDQVTLVHSYGGSLILNKWTYATQSVIPDGNINECHLGNGNIMFVYKKVVETIGILSDKYIHAKADYDYSLRAREKGFPILVCSNYCGYCTSDHSLPDLKKMKLSERIHYLKSPKGVEFSGYMYFMRRFFPLRTPFVYCSLWLKTLIPGLSGTINRIMQR